MSSKQTKTSKAPENFKITPTGKSGLVLVQKKTPGELELEWLFPANIDPLHSPKGSLVLVQHRRQKSVSTGGIVFAGETKDINRDNEQLVRVVAFGPLAYRDRKEMTPWPEGAWCSIGEFVRVPKYGKETWTIEVPGEEEPVVFSLVRDTEIMATVSDPLKVRAYAL